MLPLNQETLEDGLNAPHSLIASPRHQRPTRVVQFGEGNFLRAFADWMFDEMNAQDLFDGDVMMVQPIERGLCDRVNEQDGLYTLLLRGLMDGKVHEVRRLITSVRGCINPYTQWEGLMDLAASEQLRYVVSNTTEAGIVYTPETYEEGTCPKSFSAKVTALLHERFQKGGGGAKSGLVFLPCELIDSNGDKLLAAVKGHIADGQLSKAFLEWVEEHCVFTNTLVDRIVPGYPGEEIEALQKQLGYEDKLIDTGEIFHLWVIEGPESLAQELPFHKAGLNVVWTRDMEPYRTRKVRVLNGAHTCSVLVAHLAGLNTVGEMMNDETFGPLLKHAVGEEILSILDLPEEEKRSYADAVLERFANPFIRHELISISLNSFSKWAVRVMPSLLDHVAKHGKLPRVLSFSLAALILFYRHQVDDQGRCMGQRDAGAYRVLDDETVLQTLGECWKAHGAGLPLEDLVSQILGNTTFWGQDLTEVEGLDTLVTSSLAQMLDHGPRWAAENLMVSSVLSKR